MAGEVKCRYCGRAIVWSKTIRTWVHVGTELAMCSNYQFAEPEPEPVSEGSK